MKLNSVPSSCSLAVALRDCNYTQRYNIIAAKSKKHKHQSQGNSQPTPPRITSNAKQNLRFLKTWKDSQQQKSCIPRPSTSYRKKKKVKEDVVDAHTDVYLDPTNTSSYTKQQDIIDDVLLVDGYNVCGHWMELKKHFMNGKLVVARQKLIDQLITFSVVRELKVVVVFDAMGSGLPTHREKFAGIDVVFSGETSADTWIYKEVSALMEDGRTAVWVATSDHFQQQAAHDAGAFIWSCKTLVAEIKDSQEEAEMMRREQRMYRSTSSRGTLLKHNLDAKVVDALRNLRQKLFETELK